MSAGSFVAGLSAERRGIRITLPILDLPCPVLPIPGLRSRLLWAVPTDPVSAREGDGSAVSAPDKQLASAVRSAREARRRSGVGTGHHVQRS